MATPAGVERSRVTGLGSGYAADCRSLQNSSHNVLLEGPEAATNAMLDVLMPHMPEPIVWNQSGSSPELRADQRGTLILKDAGALRADDQNKLLRWLDDSSRGTQIQIVSTSATPLFSLVERGSFDAQLYYRLNVMLLDLQLPHTLGIQTFNSPLSPEPSSPPRCRETT